ncbi:MAG: pyridoxamine 5'-phosphate oxidase family protein [Saprospiraceae bacterium]
MLGELNEIQIKNILSSQVIGRLGCTDGLLPYIVPVTYSYDGESIYGQTVEGTKLNLLRKNPNVCFEVDIIMDMRNWKSVLITGSFEELKGNDADAAREILFNKVYTLSTSSTIHLHEHGNASSLDDSKRVKPIMYRIKIIQMSGRFEL